MYPPSNNNCNYSPILSSLFHNNIPSPMQYEHELFFQSYHHDQYCYLQQQQQQVPFIEDLSLHILADSTETVTNPSNCTDSVKINPHNTNIVTSNQGPEGIDGHENKGDSVMSSRISIIRGRISKNNKRSSNKDRHSKINTARGLRDRRMRLSLDAARKFFSLQDLLGFDKASKTVEWLLNKSDSAIEELAAKGNEGAQLPQINKQNSCSTTTGIGAICASNSISESCEVISGTDETSSNHDKNKETAKDEKKKKTKKKRKANTACRAAFESITRESRNQARARARERTKIKKMSQIDKSKATAHDLNSSGSRRPINKTCEEPGTHEQLTFHQEKQQLLGTKVNSADDCYLVTNGNWNPLFSIFNYHEQNVGISNEVEVSDFVYMWFNNDTQLS